MNWIVLVIMAAIFIVSILGGRGAELRTDSHSEIAWVIIFLVAAAAEIYLIVFRDHTLSNQMQYWIRGGWRGQVALIFWAWLAYHFVLEPVIRLAAKLIK